MAPCTALAVVFRSPMTAEIDTFISDVSTTSTNIAMASRSIRRRFAGSSTSASRSGSLVNGAPWGRSSSSQPSVGDGGVMSVRALVAVVRVVAVDDGGGGQIHFSILAGIGRPSTAICSTGPSHEPSGRPLHFFQLGVARLYEGVWEVRQRESPAQRYCTRRRCDGTVVGRAARHRAEVAATSWPFVMADGDLRWGRPVQPG